jgi:hypothetical protein
MNKADKIVRGTLGCVGLSFDILTFGVKYGLGLIWTGYNALRGKNYKLIFRKLNQGSANEFKWIKDEIDCVMK